MSSTSRSLFSLYPLNGGFDGLQIRSGGFGEQKCLLPLSRMDPRLLDSSLVTIVTELFRLIIVGKDRKNGNICGCYIMGLNSGLKHKTPIVGALLFMTSIFNIGDRNRLQDDK